MSAGSLSEVAKESRDLNHGPEDWATLAISFLGGVTGEGS
jgi:hypothetical protein